MIKTTISDDQTDHMKFIHYAIEHYTDIESTIYEFDNPPDIFRSKGVCR